eukprot:1425826-Rhodomonas_salina.1
MGHNRKLDPEAMGQIQVKLPTLRNQTPKSTFLLQIVLRLSFPVSDFARCYARRGTDIAYSAMQIPVLTSRVVLCEARAAKSNALTAHPVPFAPGCTRAGLAP